MSGQSPLKSPPEKTMTDQSAANTTDPPARCIFCGERDNDECEQCVRKMKRRAEVAELCARIASSHYAAVDSASSHHALVRRDPERARLCVARLDRAYAEHHTALSRLAELALEDR